MSTTREMNGVQSVLALRPGAKLSKVDRAALREVGIVVVQCAPEDLVAIQAVSVVPLSAMLRCALQTINGTAAMGYSKEVRAEFARRLIEAYVAYDAASAGEAK